MKADQMNKKEVGNIIKRAIRFYIYTTKEKILSFKHGAKGIKRARLLSSIIDNMVNDDKIFLTDLENFIEAYYSGKKNVISNYIHHFVNKYRKNNNLKPLTDADINLLVNGNDTRESLKTYVEFDYTNYKASKGSDDQRNINLRLLEACKTAILLYKQKGSFFNYKHGVTGLKRATLLLKIIHSITLSDLNKFIKAYSTEDYDKRKKQLTNLKLEINGKPITDNELKLLVSGKNWIASLRTYIQNVYNDYDKNIIKSKASNNDSFNNSHKDEKERSKSQIVNRIQKGIHSEKFKISIKELEFKKDHTT
ncbi:MAG: hypothetical protein EP298_05470 [Gammaproteobacteria bacterium]|nr:MAG: hypothetical protein EP298_05470 [Gammaproteobacteria bacterium]UTW43247.1 hypothetical protein KFE69_03635 [bacterium SCSIO 12844]